MTCNYCRSTEFTIIAEYARFEKQNILQCNKCGLVMLEIKTKKKDLESFYINSEYRQISTAQVQSAEEHFNDQVTRNDIRDRIHFISNYIHLKGKKVLEIGSASGGMLEKLLENGVKEATGIELDEKYGKFARDRGLAILNRPIEELDLRGKFDAVVSFHTMEHVFDPGTVMQSVYTALKPDGIFLGEVPNQNDWRIGIFNDEIVKRFHYDPTHLYYYSPSTLTNYLKTSGFIDIDLGTVERYNSLLQLRNILSHWDSKQNVDEILRKFIFPKDTKDEARLPDFNNETESQFNRIFEKAVNAELMGNCLRWIARKHDRRAENTGTH